MIRATCRALPLLFLFALSAQAAVFEEEPKVSTDPIGSPFYRHLAHETNLDLRELAKLELKGFGRTETVTLVLLSKATGAPIKDYANRRLGDIDGKKAVTLENLTKEAGLDYPTLYKNAQAVKEGIESKGDRNLPAPMYPDKDDKDFKPKNVPYGE
jgi:hypothetical protein